MNVRDTQSATVGGLKTADLLAALGQLGLDGRDLCRTPGMVRKVRLGDIPGRGDRQESIGGPPLNTGRAVGRSPPRARSSPSPCRWNNCTRGASGFLTDVRPSPTPLTSTHFHTGDALARAFASLRKVDSRS
jgi:hypothetical protein